jgi:CRISPR-associated protein Csm3
MSVPKSFVRALKGVVDIALELEVRTGLLIRMPVQAQAYRIGGAEQYPMVTRRVYSGGLELEVPYIPGSSFKGRMRSLLELALGKKLYTTDEKIWQHVRSLSAMSLEDFVADVLDRCVIDELFGYAAANYRQIKEGFEEAQKRGVRLRVSSPDEVFKHMTVTRLLVEDFFPTEDYVRKANVKSIAEFLEEKSENRLDRVTAAADPREAVRVKPGVRFGGRLKLLVFDLDVDHLSRYLGTIATGLRLIEETYLGSSGSRGYGRVKFVKIEVGASKVEVVDGFPKLRVLERPRESYGSVEELERKVGEVAEQLRREVFG